MKKLYLLLLIALLGFSLSLYAGGAQDKPEAEKMIVYHWWTAGGEKEAIDALFQAFLEDHPELEIVENPVSGGGGGVMRGQIKTMVMAGNSPDTFQLTYGTGMLSSFGEVLTPIDDLFKDFPIPEMVKKMGQVDGKQVSIPLNIMRNNCLWYNKKIVDKLGIDMDFTGFDEILTVLEKIKTSGYVPFVIGAGAGQQFWLGQITEQMILGAPHGGPEYITRLYNGKADPAHDQAIREMLQFLSVLIERGYINNDYSALTWDQAADVLMRDEGVFFSMGDWAKGHFTAAGWEPKVDFDYIPNPGTNGFFTLHFDGFSLCKNAPHPDITMEWLKFLTTAEAETVFCPLKGATPPRLDAPTDMYDEISLDILSDFRNPKTKIVQSIFAQPPEEYLGVIGSMLSGFMENPNVDQGVKDYAAAYKTIFK
ncbi:ABC transporter substrate-binding protein [Marispirochaeta sp.]|jgi:glucose/mannose transport system substrate-binding protein|uniref:ABC transporter substrate-binding protein n=1 Tax=Marispirochaeta sp. TaxID=2038653 RepID=UPI0029C74D2C|nr:ABC transporter substrate-binding protein [Marispirochaeta sp.]